MTFWPAPFSDGPVVATIAVPGSKSITNRALILAALAAEINRLGGNVTEEPDGLSIVPTPLHGGRVETYEDHRMATAGAVIGLAVPGVQVENIATTAKTMPGFTDLWSRLLGGV